MLSGLLMRNVILESEIFFFVNFLEVVRDGTDGRLRTRVKGKDNCRFSFLIVDC